MNWKKYILMLAVLCFAGISVGGYGCGKKATQPLAYSKLETGGLEIVGLTDAGRELSEITIPAKLDGEDVLSVAREAFRDCGNLKSVTIEEGITSIGENAFLSCYNLENVAFPDSVISIGTNVLKATKWESEYFKNNSELVVNGILVEARPKSDIYTVPDQVKKIGAGALYNNDKIKEVKLPKAIEYIGNLAFANCKELEKAEIPGGVIEIGYGAFSGCEKLEVEVPAAVNAVGASSFFGVKKLTYTGKLDTKNWGYMNGDVNNSGKEAESKSDK